MNAKTSLLPLQLNHTSQRNDCEENIRHLLGLPVVKTEEDKDIG